MADLSQVKPEDIREFAVGSFPADLGIEPLEIEDDHARGRILVESRHLHPGGFVHGGVWTALGDTVAAWATFRAIPPGYDFTTIELKLNVFGAGRTRRRDRRRGPRPLHAGRSTAVIEVRIDRIRDGVSKLAANLVVSQFVIPPGDPLAI